MVGLRQVQLFDLQLLLLLLSLGSRYAGILMALGVQGGGQPRLQRRGCCALLLAGAAQRSGAQVLCHLKVVPSAHGRSERTQSV